MNSRPGMSLLCAALALLAVCNAALAEQVIDVHFVNDATSGQEVLKAQATYEHHGAALRRVLLAFPGYADLHPWIAEATSVSPAVDGRSEILIRFKFPWPAGQRWSRIEVNTDHQDVITWRQVEGTMNANRGQLKLVASGQRIRVDYSAVINAGFPDAWTRGFKKQFVTEFIDAAHVRAADTDTGRLRIADSSPNR